MVGKRPVRDDQHGMTGYAYGCRCVDCKKATSEYSAQYQRDRRNADPIYRAKQYESRYVRKRMRQEYLASLKLERGCADCGYKAHPDALHFDHLPGYLKLFDIASAKTCSLDRIHEEIDKCEVVCANCHQIRTSTRRKNKTKGGAY